LAWRSRRRCCCEPTRSSSSARGERGYEGLVAKD